MSKEGRPRPLVLDQVMLFQLCGDEGFYASLPPGFEDLAELGREAYRQSVAWALGTAACQGCTTLGKVILPVQNQLGRRLAAVHAADAATLGPLVRYVARLRGFRPEPLVLFYIDEDNRARKLSV